MNSSQCSPSADSQFGPLVQCRSSFDFTLIFEDSFLSIIPSALLLLLAPARLIYLFQRKRIVRGYSLQWSKLGTILIFSALQLSLLILWIIKSSSFNRSTATVASSTLAFVDSLFLACLSYLEHSKSLKPSALLNCFLFFTLFFDIVRTRTLWLILGYGAIPILFTTSCGFKFIILALEATEKRKYIQSAEVYSPEKTSGILGSSLFLWLHRLVFTGFKKDLVMEDLYPLDQEMMTTNLRSRFQKHWTKDSQKQKFGLYKAVFLALKWQILAPIPAGVTLIAFTICQPLLLNKFLQYLMESPQEPNSANHGYGFMAAYAVVYVGIAVSTALYWHRMYRTTTMLRSVLVSAIYEKALGISITTLDDSAAVSLMSTDIERIIDGFATLHDVWFNCLQIGVATWLLEIQLGLACIAPILLVIFCAAFSVFVGSLAGKRQPRWMEALQKRVGVTSSMLLAMKGVKMMGLTQELGQLIQGLRLQEIKSATKFRECRLYFIALGYIPQQIGPFLALAIYSARSSDPLDASRAFTSLALVALLTVPLGNLIFSLQPLLAAKGCFERVETFLMQENKNNHRINVPLSSEPSLFDVTSKNLLLNLEKAEAATMLQKQPQDSIDPAIKIENGAFSWVSGQPVLNNININFALSQVTLVVGPVASGKSTLLKALLDELPHCEGIVQIYSNGPKIAFSDQTPWLVNLSVRENIVGFSDIDLLWYRTVIHACCLDEDIKALPDGDATTVGSNGFSLSGGQKQRVAIARAVYSKAELLILDDVLSGQDTITQEHLVSRLLGPQGLLRKSRTTVVFATHTVNSLAFSDHIVILEKNGIILDQGSYENLKARGSLEHLAQEQYPPKHNDYEEIEVLKPFGISKTEAFRRHQINKSSTDSKQPTSDRAVYNYYFKAAGPGSVIISWVTQATSAFFFVFPSIWLEFWTNNNLKHPNTHLDKYLGVYGAFQLISILCIVICAWEVLQIMAAGTGAKLHSIILRTILAAPMSFFAKTDSGTMINRQDIQLIDGELPFNLLSCGLNGLTSIGQAAVVATASKYIIISFPFLILLLYFLQSFYLRTSKRLRLLDLEAKSPLYTQFLETLNGLAHIRAFQWQTGSLTKANNLLDISQQPFYLLFMIQRWLTLVLDLTCAGLAFLVVTLAVHLRSSPGFTGVALLSIISLATNIADFIKAWTKLETSIGAVSRIKTFEQETLPESSADITKRPQARWPETGEIEFRGVSASYNETDNNVLNDINILIKPGEKLGICGRSGSGKSSFILSLFRMIELNTGSIFIDNTDITTIPRQEIRSKLNALPQEPYFLSSTVRMNMDPYKASTDDLIIQALEKVGLWPALESKGGLDMELSIEALSHGQRQLFCLARATIRDCKIIVLDEATSSVDRKTDEVMQHIIRDSFPNKTILVVAHRLETIMDFDRIAVFDKGSLVECDSPQNLLARGSVFRQLYDSYQKNANDVEKVGVYVGDVIVRSSLLE